MKYEIYIKFENKEKEEFYKQCGYLWEMLYEIRDLLEYTLPEGELEYIRIE